LENLPSEIKTVKDLWVFHKEAKRQPRAALKVFDTI